MAFLTFSLDFQTGATAGEPERERDELSRRPGAGLALQFSVPAHLQRSAGGTADAKAPRSSQDAAARRDVKRSVPLSSDRPPYTAASPAGSASRV